MPPEPDENGGFNWTLLLLFLAILLAAILVPNFLRIRTTSAPVSCISYLKQLEGAQEQWALENKKSVGTLVDTNGVVVFLKNSAMPACPAGGVYTFGQVGKPPKCSIPGHTL